MLANEVVVGVGAVCVALIAVVTVLRKSGRFVWMSFEVMSRLKEFLGDALPDKENGKPGLMEMVRETKTELSETRQELSDTRAELAETRQELGKYKEAHDSHMTRYHGEGPNHVAPMVRGRRGR